MDTAITASAANAPRNIARDAASADIMASVADAVSADGMDAAETATT